MAGQEPLIPPDAWLEELSGSLIRLNDRLKESEINTLMQKASSNAISIEEKHHLMRLLEEQHS
jgi:hypothetical protein